MIIHPYTSQTITSQKKEPSQVRGKIVDVSMKNVEAEILQGSHLCPVLVDFWAPWCGPCQQFIPVLEGLHKKYPQPWILAKINVDTEPQLAAQFRIQSIPAVVLVAKGRPLEAFTGPIPEADLIKLLDKAHQLYKNDNKDKDEDPRVVAAHAFSHENYTQSADLLNHCLATNSQLSPRDSERLILSHAFLGQIPQAIERLHILEKPEPIKNWLAHWQGTPSHAVDKWLSQLPNDKAKESLILLFSLLGSDHTLTQEGRKKMSRILFA